MNTKLYVGNLAATTTERDLQNLCSPHGNVAEVNLPLERESGQSRGFAIVTMATPEGAQAAILALNGKDVETRVLAVTEHVSARQSPSAAAHKGRTQGPVARQEVSAFRRLFRVF
jgi:RNA recognition motif-containing protein